MTILPSRQWVSLLTFKQIPIGCHPNFW